MKDRHRIYTVSLLSKKFEDAFLSLPEILWSELFLPKIMELSFWDESNLIPGGMKAGEMLKESLVEIEEDATVIIHHHFELP